MKINTTILVCLMTVFLPQLLRAQLSCSNVFDKSQVFDVQMERQAEFMRKVAVPMVVHGELIWNIEKSDAFTSFDKKFSSEVGALAQRQDDILVSHLQKTMNRKSYEISKMRKDITSELGVIEYQMNKVKAHQRKRMSESLPRELMEYKGKIAYGIRVVYVKEGRVLSSHTFIHGMVYEKGDLQNGQKVGITVKAIPFSGIIENVIVEQVSGQSRLQVLLRDAEGAEFSMTSVDRMNNGDIFSMKVYDQYW